MIKLYKIMLMLLWIILIIIGFKISDNKDDAYYFLLLGCITIIGIYL